MLDIFLLQNYFIELNLNKKNINPFNRLILNLLVFLIISMENLLTYSISNPL